MRPLSLELHGFSAFRAPTVIDFRGHDLIALTGPTGAGKSTIIDGMVFALYGSVARYENENLVAPIINAVSAEARVRFDFSIGDDEYSAVRVVRRTSGGASTKEARLERGDEILASTALEVTAEVEKLLGLSFTQFTKTVVLPQGDFARFLTEKASSRQRLLRRLLGLDVFAEVGKSARRQARHLSSQRQAFEQALEDDRDQVSESDIANLQKRAAKVVEVLAKATSSSQARSAALDDFATTEAAIERLDGHSDALALLVMPAEAKTFATTLTKAESSTAAAQKKTDAAEGKFLAAEAARLQLLDSSELDALLAAHEQLAELAQEELELVAAAVVSAEVLATVTASAEQAREALGDAEELAQAARIQAGARGIAMALHVGESCPVCDQLVEDLPAHTGDRHLAKAEKALIAAEAAKDVAAKRAIEVVGEVQSATAKHADREARADSVSQAVLALSAGLADQPTLKLARAIEKRVFAADAKLELTQATFDAAQSTFDDCLAAQRDAEGSGAALRRQFTDARDSVSGLAPPKPSEDSLRDDWANLVTWAKDASSEVKAQRSKLAKELSISKKVVAAAEKSLLSSSAPFLADGATTTPGQALSLIQNEHADARVTLANAQDRLARQIENVERIADLERERLVADQLGKHLASGMFERWIMADVMIDLAERASVRLIELSAGAYSLTTDGTDFQIVDHRNADELRSARTLSGGETFLTSLALALALAESITELASTSTPPLESMFLDEGFGTLDPETLDTVASAIEELGASGRMIGIVTHIRDLADRIPTRFDVQRNPSGSIVTQQTETADRDNNLPGPRKTNRTETAVR